MTLAKEYVPKTAGRSTRRWKVIRKQAFDRDMRANAPCWICGKPINYAAPAHDPWSWEPDHVLPVSTHPEYAEDITNIRPSHARCNNLRGQADKAARKHAQDLGEPSENWGF